MKTNSITNGGTSSRVRVQNGADRLCRILVVDDDISIRELNAEVLIQSGYEVDTAEDGVEGWEALSANRYDLLITDNTMPRVSGIELIRKVREAGMELPVIMATGALPAHSTTGDSWHKIDGTLLKPFAPHELVETVTRVLQGTGSARVQLKCQ